MATSSGVRRLGLILVVTALAGSGLLAQPASAAARTQEREIILLVGTVELDPSLEQALTAALSDSSSLLGEAAYFAATDLRTADGWALVSVVGFAAIAADQSWHAEDGSWFGLILAHEIETGIWEAGVQRSEPFSSMLSQVPATVLDPNETSALDDRFALRAAASPNIFPWQSGTAMIYGPLGIHDGGSGWKAVDMATDGNISAGHSPGIAVAAEPGTIDYICKDGITVTIRMGGFLYAHLLDNAGLYAGRYFAQGDELGQLKSGNFSAACGYGYQPSNWVHLHWAFPNGDLQVENWTLSMATGLWTNGVTTVAPGSGWIVARPSPPPPPSPTPQPSPTATLAASGQQGNEGWGMFSLPAPTHGALSSSTELLLGGAVATVSTLEPSQYGRLPGPEVQDDSLRSAATSTPVVQFTESGGGTVEEHNTLTALGNDVPQLTSDLAAVQAESPQVSDAGSAEFTASGLQPLDSEPVTAAALEVAIVQQPVASLAPPRLRMPPAPPSLFFLKSR